MKISSVFYVHRDHVTLEWPGFKGHHNDQFSVLLHRDHVTLEWPGFKGYHEDQFSVLLLSLIHI